MTVSAAMKPVGQIDGLQVFWADPGTFQQPGLYYWNGKENVHIPLPPVQHQEALAAVKRLVDAGVEATDRRAILAEACRHGTGTRTWTSPIGIARCMKCS